MDSVVLVVEDEPDLNEVMGAFVEFAGYIYRPALTGMAAVQAAQAVPCALIMLDIRLPDMDGFEVCRLLKADPTTAKVPIVFLTAIENKDFHQRGVQSGAVAYLCKPCNLDLLMDTLHHYAPLITNYKPA